MAIINCTKYPYLTDLFGTSDIGSTLHSYVLLTEATKNPSLESLIGQYQPLTKENAYFQLYIQQRHLNSEYLAHDLVDDDKCPYIARAVLILKYIRVNPTLECHITITPKYNDYCRSTLHPYAYIVARQLLKALACCHKRHVCHDNVGPSSITWQWSNKKKPHIYLTNFANAEHTNMNYLLDFKYDICEGDVRRAGVLFLELLLNEDMSHAYSDYIIPSHIRTQYYQKINCPVTCDLLEDLIGGDPSERISAKQALKHKIFRK